MHLLARRETEKMTKDICLPAGSLSEKCHLLLTGRTEPPNQQSDHESDSLYEAQRKFFQEDW
ncbi:hypothetical protein NQZ68_040601, partial [Dissostichus eleginoides]